MRSVVSSSLAAGVALFVVGAAFHFVVIPAVAPGIPPQFKNLALFRLWPGWTATYMAIHPFAYGFVFAAVYLGLRRWSGFPPGIRGGLVYGFGVFLVGSLPVYLLAFASFAVSIEVTLFWVVQSLLQYMLAGVAVAWVADDASVRASTGLRAPAESPTTRLPEPLERAEYVPPPNVEWIEHPFVVINSRVSLYHHAVYGRGKCLQYDDDPGPEYLYSDYYLIVEDSEADHSRYWMSAESWGLFEDLMGQPAGFEFTREGTKGSQQYKVLAVHVPSDGKAFRLADLIEFRRVEP